MTHTAEDTDATPTTGRLRRLLERLARVVRVLAWIAVVVVALAFLFRLLNFDNGPASYMVAIVPWLTFGAIALAAGAAAFRRWRLTVAAGVLGLLGSAWLAPVMVADRGAGDPELTVATVNMLFGNADAGEVVALVVDHDVDVLAIEEVTWEAVERLAAAGLDDVLPYSQRNPGEWAEGTAIYSRYPLTGGEGVGSTYFTTVRATVAAPGGEFTFYAAHPRPPLPQFTAGWLADMSEIEWMLSEESGPVLAAGDFNSTRDHAAFRAILGLGFRDAADQAGAGFLPTYPERRVIGPLVGIDHVLERDSGLTATNMDTVTVTGTDHRAVVVQYAPAAGVS